MPELLAGGFFYGGPAPTDAVGAIKAELMLVFAVSRRDGTTHLVMSPLEFMQRLAAHSSVSFVVASSSLRMSLQGRNPLHTEPSSSHRAAVASTGSIRLQNQNATFEPRR